MTGKASDEEAAWRDLVAQFGSPTADDAPSPWPAREDLPDPMTTDPPAPESSGTHGSAAASESPDPEGTDPPSSKTRADPPDTKVSAHPPRPKSPADPPGPKASAHPPRPETPADPPGAMTSAHPPQPNAPAHPPRPETPAAAAGSETSAAAAGSETSADVAGSATSADTPAADPQDDSPAAKMPADFRLAGSIDSPVPGETGGTESPVAEIFADPPIEETPAGVGPVPGVIPAPPQFRIIRPALPSPLPDADDDERYVPPIPPPLPRLDPTSKLAWAALFGGPGYLLVSVMAGWQISGVAAFVAVAAFVGGFATLIMRLGDRPPGDSGPDDGAVV
jgi:hypothetical protein